MRIIKDKKIHEAICRIAANHIIAQDALNKAHDSGKMPLEQWIDAVEHLADNTVEAATLIGGMKGLSMVNEIMNKRMFNNKPKANEDNPQQDNTVQGIQDR